MATTFATAKAALDEIAERLRTNNARLATAKSSTATAKSDLTAMGTAYAAIIQDIAAAAAANPNNPALTTMKAEADLLVAEFQAAKTRATTMNNAIKDL
jgi:hypothetical protein